MRSIRGSAEREEEQYPEYAEDLMRSRESLGNTMNHVSLPDLPRDRSVPRISSSTGEYDAPELASPKSPSLEELRARAERKEKLRKDRHQAVPDKIAFRAEKYPIYLKLMEDEIKVCNKNIDRFNLLTKNTINNAKLKNIPDEQVIDKIIILLR